MQLSDYKDQGFKSWLLARGADLQRPTKEWELLRFFTHEGVGTVYTNSKNRVTLTGVAGAAYQAFTHGEPWKALPRPRDKRQARWQQWNLLTERDGPWCVYCGTWLHFEDFTLEHFLAKTHGGTNYYANLGLACESCNRHLGLLPVAQKILLALKRRMKSETFQSEARSNGPSPLPEPDRGGGMG